MKSGSDEGLSEWCDGFGAGLWIGSVATMLAMILLMLVLRAVFG